MKLAIALLGGILVLASATMSPAEVNCKQVRKYLQTGRSVKDVAETMVIDEADVKKCQEEAGGADAGKAGSDPKAAAPAEGH